MKVKNAVPSVNGRLNVRGRYLCDESGNRVQLRGISTHGIEWYPEYNTETFYREMKEDWHANAMRLAMYTTGDKRAYIDDPATVGEIVRQGIIFTGKADMYTLVDWHILGDNDPMMHVEEAKTFFDKISREFAEDPHVIYEICNEPNGDDVTWDVIKTYANEVIPVIRKNSPDALILVGTPRWSQRVDLAAEAPLDYDNVMYVLHFYAATHKEELRDILRTALSKELPLFVTEYGICEASGNGELNFEEAGKWLSLLDENDISYCAWNFSNCDESGALLKKDCKKTSGFTEEDLNESGRWQKKMLLSHFEA